MNDVYQKPGRATMCPAGPLRLARSIRASPACRRLSIALVLTLGTLVSALPTALWLMCAFTSDAHHCKAMARAAEAATGARSYAGDVGGNISTEIFFVE